MTPRKPYPSDISREQFESIRPLLEGVRMRTKPRPDRLKHLDAIMPTPKGEVRMQLDLRVSKPRAAITIPQGLDGWFVWKGKQYRIRAGRQEFAL